MACLDESKEMISFFGFELPVSSIGAGGWDDCNGGRAQLGEDGERQDAWLLQNYLGNSEHPANEIVQDKKAAWVMLTRGY